MSNWEVIQNEWETTKITFKDLAEKHNVKDSTIRSRKNREKWQRNDATQRTTKKKNVATKKSTEKQKSNRAKQKNRSGNPNPVKQFTKRNSAAVTHGFFSKFLPAETLEIMEQMQERLPADLIYDQIQIQYAAIIRAQQIMFVEDKDDLAKEKSQEGWGESGADKYEIQFAWDRHASFMNAQSRAMSELRSLIKQFNEMAHQDDERRLRLELMTEQVSKLKREGNPDTSKEDKLKEYFAALGGAFSES